MFIMEVNLVSFDVYNVRFHARKFPSTFSITLLIIINSCRFIRISHSEYPKYIKIPTIKYKLVEMSHDSRLFNNTPLQYS